MSFILEALRKSENARRMESAPQMMRVPLAVGRERLPIWAVILIAVLAVTVAALAAMSWRQIYGPAGPTISGGTPAALIERRGDPAQALERPSVDDEPVAAPVVEGTSSTPAATAAATTRAAAAATTVRVAPPTDAPRPASDAATPPLAPSEARAAAPATSLPSLAALRAEGLSVPALDMQLHVYSPNRSSRFVLVNGNRFGEGDEIASGTEILRIVAEGAVIRYKGREFLLTAD